MTYENLDDPDLFPDLPRRKKRKVSSRDTMTPALHSIKAHYNVSTPEIAHRSGIPHRTVEGWLHGRSMPPEWVAQMVLEKFWRIWPDALKR